MPYVLSGAELKVDVEPGGVAAMTDDLRLRIARELTTIVSLYADLHTEALHRPANQAGLYIPGGDAMVLLGPGADVEAFGYAQISTYLGRTPGWVEEPLPDDLEPPLSFLAGWSDIIREERNQPTDLKATISREVDYIRGSLDWMLSYDENGEMRFPAADDLADGLAKHRRALETVLKAGDRAEFTRVNCIAEECPDQPRLMKLWGSQVRWDRYRCPSCRTEYDAEQFKMARTQNLHSVGADRYVLVIDAIAATGVPKATVHSWIRRDKDIKTKRDVRTLRLMVWWPDIRDRANEWRMKRSAS